MALEDLTGADKYINALNASNPATPDDIPEGDDHIRGVKNVLLNTFPNIDGKVFASDEELNYLSGAITAVSTFLGAADVTAMQQAMNVEVGVDALAFSANVLFDNTTATLSAGYPTDIEDMGASGAGLVTPDLTLEFLKELDANGSFALGAPAVNGGCDIYAANSALVTPTFASYTLVVGSYDGVSGNSNLLSVRKFGTTSILIITQLG